jgi:hypothetical protein
MAEANKTVISKVEAIFAELAEDRSARLVGSHIATEAQDAIADALTKEHSAKVAREIAFHLTDWNSDAAFIVALILFPERFSQEEVDAGISLFLIHAPSHIVAAAKLAKQEMST